MSKYRVWYIPQIPGEPFHVESDLEGNPLASKILAEQILDVLQRFSAFEYEQRVKPDYIDGGGIEVWNEEILGWEDVDDGW